MCFEYLDQLAADCEKAKTVTPIRTLTILHGDPVPDHLAKETGIYVVTEVGGNPEKTFKEMKACKWPDGNKKAKQYMPRVNAESKTMYVGSSEDLKKRLEEHIHQPVSRETSALRMGKGWFKGEWKIEVELYDPSTVKKGLIQLI